MALYQLTKENVENIFIFLKRVDIKGSESVPLVAILQALQTPVIVPTEDLAKKVEPPAETPQLKKKTKNAITKRSKQSNKK